MLHPRTSALLLFVLLALGVTSCAQEEAPLLLQPGSDAGADASLGQVGPQGVRVCTQTHAESLPARLVAMSANAQTSGMVVLVSDLFERFNETCKPCHTASADNGGQGGFQIATSTDFSTRMTPDVLRHVTNAKCPSSEDSTNPDDSMPPCNSPTGQTYGARPETDPVRQFAELVTAWMKAGSASSFTVGGGSGADAGADGGAANPYALTPADGNAMTNIGNCVPSAAMIAIEDTKSKALDAMFAGLRANPTGKTAAEVIGLPEHLADTDLTTFDSAALAQYGVVAYAPGYPLWSDNAGKLRYVRVPRGQSIQFNKATQEFEIPPNTRFYKTFMKQIADSDGSYRYRKIETRLIVSRPDQNNADGTVAQTALFGSYQWNADESDATLVETPLNSGEPFSDTVLLYHTDEQLAAAVLSSNPTDSEGALLEANAARHYAIPSSPRCVQCHMGSPSAAFVLGFTPLQINRRPAGSGGTIEATGPDELTQLQRFIDAGIVTGVDSPGDVLPLEQSQGSRTPRNGAELTAQAYMLGNCAHCHNPRGFPTVQNPVLQGVLDFLPSAAGGIFQFPLERTSPRVGRGNSGTTPIPYITPSLVDLPRVNVQTGGQAGDPFVLGARGFAISVAYAPWRSLVYRNVDNAFAYVDDLAIFPHMPFNTPGFDPRAKQILSDWMVSIPAVRKHPEIPEYAYVVGAGLESNDIGGSTFDTEPQPYVEVPPGAAGYAGAVRAAQQRLAILHTGDNAAVPLASNGGQIVSRYADLGETLDILDPAVIANPVCHQVPASASYLGLNGTGEIPVPDQPHWVNTDLTSPPGAWAPRQSNWPTALAEQNVPPFVTSGGCTAPAGAAAAHADQVDAVSLLQTASLDQVRAFVTNPEPFGLWQQKPGCTFPSSVPTVQSFTASTSPPRPHWMDVVSPAPDAPVYMQTPGAAVFKMICINCHGPKADSNGRLAQNLATMTGGNALVADFRDGLFGPVGASEATSNRHAQFGLSALTAVDAGAGVIASWTQAPDGTPLTDDDRAARYMAWMGLGGTSVKIPVEILQIVAVTKVLDQQRVITSGLSANMLSQAKALCLSTLGAAPANGPILNFETGNGHGFFDAKTFATSLIRQNYDGELWLRLCALVNPPPFTC